MPCLAVFQEVDTEGEKFDGLLGLAPWQYYEDEWYKPPFILDTLFENGLIEQRSLSFRYRSEGEQSVLIFGSPDDDLIGEFDTSGYETIVNRGQLYYVALKGSSFGGVQLGDGSSTTALIDTGTSLLYMPVQEYQNLVEEYKRRGAEFGCKIGWERCAPCESID